MTDTSHPRCPANWSYPTQTSALAPAVSRNLAKPVLSRAACKRPLLVTDPGLANLPMIPEAIENLTAAGLSGAVFSDVQGNPISANVTAGIEAYKSSNARRHYCMGWR